MTDDPPTGDEPGPVQGDGHRDRSGDGHRNGNANGDRDGNASGDRDDGGTGDPGAGLTPDELAGVVDLFGGLTRAELDRALAELAARQGAHGGGDVDGAVRSYHLVAVEPATALDDPAVDPDGEVLVVGPVAFPRLPPGAEDLPHVLEVPQREVDRQRAAARVEERLRGDAARAVAAGDAERMRHLLDVTYDLETWADADAADARRRLDAALTDVSEGE
jgi:hypothetical protein